MEIRINKDTVTHIEIHDFYTTSYTWCEEKPIKFLWIFNDGKYEEGYWNNGQQSHWNWKLDKTKNYVDRNGVLVEKPVIEVYTGKHLIDRRYFESLAAAQKYCKGKFPNVNIVLNNGQV